MASKQGKTTGNKKTLKTAENQSAGKPPHGENKEEGQKGKTQKIDPEIQKLRDRLAEQAKQNEAAQKQLKDTYLESLRTFRADIMSEVSKKCDGDRESKKDGRLWINILEGFGILTGVIFLALLTVRLWPSDNLGVMVPAGHLQVESSSKSEDHPSSLGPRGGGSFSSSYLGLEKATIYEFSDPRRDESLGTIILPNEKTGRAFYIGSDGKMPDWDFKVKVPEGFVPVVHPKWTDPKGRHIIVFMKKR